MLATRSVAALLLALGAGGAFADVRMGTLYIGERNNSNPPTTGSGADYAETSAEQAAADARRAAKPQPQPRTSAPAPAAAQPQTPPSAIEADTPYPEALPQPAPGGMPDARITPEQQTARPAPAAAAAPAPARNGAFVARDPAARRYYEGPSRDRLTDAVADTPRPARGSAYKLWDAVSAPLEMNAAQVARTPGLDDADGAARAEYERRILGQASVAATSRAPEPAPPAAMPAAAPAAAGEVFVSVDVDEKKDLKDAVAGLSSVSGFRLDPRFPPQAAEAFSAGSAGAAARAATSLRGWLPADKLNAVVGAPGVLRVQVDHSGPRPEGSSSALTTLVVGLRIPAQTSAGETFQREISELSSTARFQWTRTVGFQAIPGSKDVALIVVGELPVTRIPRLLEDPSVLKVGPAPLTPAAAEPAPKTSRLEDFFSYARAKAPFLVALTLLLLLPSVGGGLLKLGQAFVPYER